MSLSTNFPTIRPSLLLDFAKSRTVDPRITFTRASTATYFDEDGILQSAAADRPRIDFDPSTLVCNGLLIEEQRTNSIRNNTMQGAVAGTPGTNPTNWVVTGAGGNITSSEIVSVTTESGINAIDYKYVFSGAATANIRQDSTTLIAASNGQTWTASAYAKLAGGTLSNCTVSIAIQQYNSGGTVLNTESQTFTPTGSGLATQRISVTKTLDQATVAYVIMRLSIVASGAADITLRIGLPQLELGAFATSVIPTTTTALTRNADAASMTGTNFSSWYNASEGTLLSEWITSVSDATNNRGIAAIDDGTNNNRVSMFIPNSILGASLTVAARVVSGGSSTNPANSGSITLSSVAKSALAYGVGTNQAGLSVNGGTPTTASPAAAPVSPSILRIGTIFGVTYLSGHIRRLTYYPARLVDAQLQALTL